MTLFSFGMYAQTSQKWFWRQKTSADGGIARNDLKKWLKHLFKKRMDILKKGIFGYLMI